MRFQKAQDYANRRRAEILLGRAPRRGKSGLAFSSEPAPIAVGVLRIESRVPGGKWTTIHEDKNLVVTQAENIMAQMAIGASNSALSYIELGNPLFPANPPTLADLGLQQSTGQRQAVVLTASGNVVTAVATWTTTQGNGFTYTEAGLFNGTLGAGLMFARKTFAGITKTAAFELQFTWMITFLVNTSGGECSGVALIGPGTVSAFTVYLSGDIGAGGQKSIAANFDFNVGANNVDVFLQGQRLVPGVHYLEAAGGSLVAPTLGPSTNKGINLIGWTLTPPGDKEVFLIQRSQG